MKTALKIIGGIIILGTAGASDNNAITLTQALVQAMIGVGCFLVANLCVRTKHFKKRCNNVSKNRKLQRVSTHNNG